MAVSNRKGDNLHMWSDLRLYPFWVQPASPMRWCCTKVVRFILFGCLCLLNSAKVDEAKVASTLTLLTRAHSHADTIASRSS